MAIKVINNILFALLSIFLILVGVGCDGQDRGQDESGDESNGDRIAVVATTTIVGDVVKEVGGDLIELRILVPPEADPHVYEVSPKDVASLEEADLVFINGLGLEKLLEPILEDSRSLGKVISVSDGAESLDSSSDPSTADPEDDPDPHVWFDPQRVAIWVDNIEEALSEEDPDGADVFGINAESYRQELKELDHWIQEEIEKVPADRRQIVTDHDSLGYLVDRYDIELIGAVVPGYNTQVEPAARELVELIAAIDSHDSAVVFVSDSVNSKIAEQIARDTGIQLVPLTTGSLTDTSGPAPTYLEFMRRTIETITSALLSTGG